MNGRERILMALGGGRPDRVPLYIHAINEKTILGIAREFLPDLPAVKSVYDMDRDEIAKLLEALFFIHEYFGVDGITAFDIFNETPIDDGRFRDPWGIVYQKTPYGLAVPVRHPIRDRADFERFEAPAPSLRDLGLLIAVRARFGREKALFWMMRGTFVWSHRLMGMENLMVTMFDDPSLVHGIAEMVCRHNLRKLDLLVEAGMDVLIVEDDIADKNSLMIAPDQFREFVHPYNKRVADAARERGVKVICHSDGNLWEIMDLLAETYDGLNPLEPQAGMDLAKVKQRYGDRLCLLGNIDCQYVLTRGTLAEVEQAVRDAIAAAADGGGYILCDSNTLHPGVDPRNCIAMFEAAKRYGVYSPQTGAIR